MPPPLSNSHLESDNVRAMEVDRLKGEVLRLVVKDDDATEIRDRHLGCCSLVCSRISHVNPPCDIRLLKNAKVDVHLGYSCGTIEYLTYEYIYYTLIIKKLSYNSQVPPHVFN